MDLLKIAIYIIAGINIFLAGSFTCAHYTRTRNLSDFWIQFAITLTLGFAYLFLSSLNSIWHYFDRIFQLTFFWHFFVMEDYHGLKLDALKYFETQLAYRKSNSIQDRIFRYSIKLIFKRNMYKAKELKVV